jgi:uncharacterized protein (TIGR03663 family)
MITEPSKTNAGSTQPWLLFFFIALGIAFRFWSLDLRPLHHDESIHVMFGRYFFDWPNDNYYKYNPEYHGPLLYNMLRFTYETFGDSEASARGLIAVFGSAFLFLPYLLRRYLEPGIVLALTAAISLSPTMIFWSRFVREDIFVLTGMLMMLWGILGARPSLKSMWVLLGAVFQYASKENSYVTIAMFWGFFLADWLWRRVIEKKAEPFPLLFLAPVPFVVGSFLHVGSMHLSRITMDIGALLSAVLILADCFRSNWAADAESSFVSRMYAHVVQYRNHFLASFLGAALLFAYLFSAGFRYPQGILDGLYYKGITYWVDKHSIERIKGPFLFHLYELAWYELFFIIAIIIHAFHFYQRQSKMICWTILTTLGLATCAALYQAVFASPVEAEPTFFLWKALKLKNAMDIFGAPVLFIHAILVPLGHHQKKEWNLSFLGYWYAATFFTYAYLGEKVPWLSSYPLVLGWIYLAAYINYARNARFELKTLSERLPIGKILGLLGWITISVSLIGIVEEALRFDVLYQGVPFSFVKVLEPFQMALVIGLALIAVGWFDKFYRIVDRPVMIAKFVLFAFTIFTFRVACITNFEFKYHELGYISQVHTTQEAKDIALKIRNEILVNTNPSRPSVLVDGDATWPMTWYFRDLPTYKFSASAEERKTFTYIFQNESEAVPDGYEKTILKLRGWWVPDFRQMSIRRFFTMALNQRVWGGYGYSNVAFLKKKGS